MIFQCFPINSAWGRFDRDHPVEGKCPLATNPTTTALYIPNSVLDAILFIMPIPYIWHIQMALPQKLALIGVFAVGLFVTGVSITRIYYLNSLGWTDGDITWALSNGIIWSDTEINLSIICGSSSSPSAVQSS